MTASPAADAREQHLAWQRKELPAVEEVRPGVWSLPTPMPGSPLGYVLAYAIETDDGLALVDTGCPADECWDALMAGLAVLGRAPEEVSDVLITHVHFDHHGLTRRLVEASGARVHMHREDAAWLERMLGAESAPMTDWIIDRGAPQDEADRLADGLVTSLPRSEFARMPIGDRLVEDGDRPLPGRPELRAVWTPGHTDGHLCFELEDERLLLSGDHVLPRITPHVTRPPGEAGNPLDAYLGSLRKVRDLDVVEVLPAHEYRFDDLACRIDEMLDHHERRLEEIERAAAGTTTWDIARTISWSRGWDGTEGIVRQTALSETFTHLRHLESLNRVRRTSKHPDIWDIAV